MAKMHTDPTTNTNPVTVQVWWTPSCGAIHIETNPKSIGFDCPDELPAGWADED